MVEEPNSEEFAVPEALLTRLLGVAATDLLSDHVLLAFDAETGTLAAANDSTVVQLGLDLDNPIQPTFSEMIGADADGHWSSVTSGQKPSWSGPLEGAMGLSVSGAAQASRCEADDGGAYVVVHLVPQATPEAGGEPALGEVPASPADQVLGSIHFDMDGNIKSMNDPAMSALQDYGEELIGRNHDTLWPKEVCQSEYYFEFWEKLRQGRTVEGQHRHITAVDGEAWFQSVYVPIKDSSGIATEVVQYLMDVTDEAYKSSRAAEFLEGIQSNIAMTEIDADGYVMSMNDAMAAHLQVAGEDAKGQHHDLFLEKSFSKSNEYTTAWELLAEGRTQNMRVHYRTSTQEDVWMLNTFIPVTDASDKVVKVIATGQLITKEHEALTNLTALNKASEFIFARAEFGAKGELVGGNSGFFKMFSVNPDDIENLSLRDFFTGRMQSDKRYNNFWDKMHAGETIRKLDEMQTTAGDRIHLETCYVPIFRPNGQFWKMAAFMLDVTQSVLRQRQLSIRSEIIDASNFIIEYDLDGKVRDINSKFAEKFGLISNDVVGSKLQTLYAKDESEEEAQQRMWDKVCAGETRANVYRHRTSRGVDVWLDGIYAPCKNRDGEVTSVLFIGKDVSEETLKQFGIGSKLSVLCHLQSVVEYDASGNILDANDTFLTTMGYSLREVTDQHHSMFCAPEYVQSEGYRQLWNDLANGKSFAGRVHRIGRFGRDVHLMTTYYPVRDMDGEINRIVQTAVEISNAVALEKMVQQNAEMMSNQLNENTSTSEVVETTLSELTKANDYLKDSATRQVSELEKTVDILKDVTAEMAQLSEIVEAVGEIAVQTNLLAFNAAIEAARAGEHGIGFTIVADEVRKLAEKNGQAARSISQHIEKATGFIEVGQSNTLSLTKEVLSHRDSCDQSAGLLDRIVAANTEQNKRLNEATKSLLDTYSKIEAT